jgi:hypothetical protein
VSNKKLKYIGLEDFGVCGNRIVNFTKIFTTVNYNCTGKNKLPSRDFIEVTMMIYLASAVNYVSKL